MPVEGVQRGLHLLADPFYSLLAAQRTVKQVLGQLVLSVPVSAGLRLLLPSLWYLN